MPAKYPIISFGLLTPKSLLQPEAFDNLFQAWRDTCPESIPTTYQIMDMDRKPFPSDGKFSDLRGWRESETLTLNGDGDLEGFGAIIVTNNTTTGYSTFMMNIEADSKLQNSLTEFINTAALSLDAHFGYVHRVNDLEAALAEWTNYTVKDVGTDAYREVCIYSPGLKRGIPNLFWYTVLGKPYVKTLGLESLLSSPVRNISCLSESLVALRLTSSVDDSVEDEVMFESERLKVKQYLGIQYFQPDCRQDQGVLIDLAPYL